MTTNQEEQKASDASRPKFDDVASLFGAIVPGPGSPLRPLRPFRPLPIPVRDLSGPAIVPSPSSSAGPLPEPPTELSTDTDPEPNAVAAPEPQTKPVPQKPAEPSPPLATPANPPPRPSAPSPSPRVEPKPATRPRPTEIPWPDAFEPRPNYKTPEPRNWSWLLLIPAGLVVAVGVTLIDVRALRSWVDTNLLHRTPAAAVDSPLLPAPFRTGAAQSMTDQPAPGPPNPAPSNPTPSNPEPPIPYPAIPTSPVPVPAGVEVSPPPTDPAQAPATPPIHVVIQYRRNIPGADGEARRIAALLQNTGGSVETRPQTATVKTPTITYYNPVDKEPASALATILANEAASWTVRLGTAKNPPGSIDVSMP